MAVEVIESFSNSFLKQAIKGIHKYQHFPFESDELGVVTVKKTSGGTEENIAILKQHGFQFNEIRRPNIDYSGDQGKQ